MNSLEDSLRDAYRAAADTVRPETIRPETIRPQAFGAEPDSRAQRGFSPQRGLSARLAARGRRLRSRLPARRPWLGAPLTGGQRKLGVPLAAAAAVAAIVVSATVVVPRIWSGQAGGSTASGPAGVPAQAFTGGRIPGGKPPRYFAAIMTDKNSGQQDATALEVFNSATGRVVGQLARPRPGLYFQTVAALGNDHTFVAAAEPGVPATGASGCDMWLYSFRLTQRGKPTGLTPLSVPEVPGQLNMGGLAASADGRVVAYDTAPCTYTAERTYAGQVGVIHVRSGQLATWPYRWPAGPSSLSLSADGSQLGMVSDASSGTGTSDMRNNSEWVLRTGSAAGPLERHYRKVFGPPQWPVASALSPAGTVVIAALPRYLGPHGHVHWQVTLSAFQAATGRQIRVIAVLPALSWLESADLLPSHSGRYLLMNAWNDFVERIDLATGKLSKIPGKQDFRPTAVAW